MTLGVKHVSVCICTFRRPGLLRKLLQRLERQETGGAFEYSVVITDNDGNRSAEPVVAEFAASSSIPVKYTCEPRQNIALARNEAVSHATGDYVAMIDDDEFPEDDWLARMMEACERFDAAGVLGPVRPHFEETPPRWVTDGRFWDRPEHPTGWIMHWKDCRTGNVLLPRRILDGLEEVFDPDFGKGGEDTDFFRRMMDLGLVFRWCNEGVVYETVPLERCTRGYMYRRAMLRGRTSAKIPVGRANLIARSIVAVPAYLAMLPFTLLWGQHVFMKYSIKLCDHAGRLLTLVSLNPVRER